MPARIISLQLGNIYHIYNRGSNKEAIFRNDRHYRLFLFRLSKYFYDKAEVYAYCLMPNHYHLLLKVTSSDFLKTAFHPFLVSYARSFSNETGRIGPLFQGRYQAILIKEDDYFLDCMKYIHLNPVTAGLVKNPVQWNYSSYRDYLDVHRSTFINKQECMKFFSSIEEFKEFTEFGVEDYCPKYFKDHL